MAPEAKKRKLNAPATAHRKTLKRRKVVGKQNGALRREAKNVRLDDLAWKGVAMPDQLDDFEGFFGLEEVDDVEVVKDAETGHVSFKATVLNKDKPNATDNATYNLVKAPLKEAEDERDGDGDVEAEWTGFEEGLSAGDTNTDKHHRRIDKAQAEGGVNTERIHLRDGESIGEDEESQSETDVEEAGRERLATTSFTALGDVDLEESGVDVSAWQSLDLSPDTLAAISKLGFEQPTNVQRRCIPDILAGHDVIGKAATGSGKTLAFGIPILEYYLDTVLPHQKGNTEPSQPTALILAPTRELAHQLSKHIAALCTGQTFDAPRIATITGGLSVQKQKRLLQIADIVIGTPGRLWEVIESSIGLVDKLKRIRFLVVDEADRLLSEGHFKEVEQILSALDRVNEGEEHEDAEAVESESGGNQPHASSENRQTLVFSATFHKGLQQRLSGKSRPMGDLMNKQESMDYLLKKLKFKEEKPKFIDVNPVQQMALGLKEGLVECAGTEKDLYLYALLLMHPKTRTLVFTNSISAVRRVAPLLQNLNQPVQALHSNMAQKARLRAVERFTASDSSILIATDVAARGLDIPGVQLVIHYHVPRAADMYIHRSGRTARAENRGSSILICAPEEVQGVRRLIAKVHAQSNKDGHDKRAIRTLDLDRRIVARLRPRAALAKKIADVGIAKEKGNSTDRLFAQAAEDLGVEYDSEEFENMGGGGGRQGRGNKRKQKEREDRLVRKQEVGAWRAELKALLAQRVNTGVSPRYITGGAVGVDIDALLKGEQGEFLGTVRPLDLLDGESD